MAGHLSNVAATEDRPAPGPRPPLDLSPFLTPASIAVIGASDRPGSLGAKPLRYLRKFGFQGQVWPVNPSRDSVDGIACYRTIADLPAVPDLVLIAVPAEATVGVVRDCIAVGIRHGIAFAGGFAEAGLEGARLQQELVALCRQSGFALCGPNTVGIVNTHLPLTATFAASLAGMDRLVPGAITMISQSGGMAVAAHALAQRAGYGFRGFISVGNEAVLSIADFVRLAVADIGTKVIAMYIEGMRDGGDFAGALNAARAAGKPVVVLKAGRAAASARAAAAHTGSLAGEDRVWQAVLEEYDAVRVDSLVELVDVSLWLGARSTGGLERADRVAIVGFGGETAASLAQTVETRGLSVVPPGERLREALADRAAGGITVGAGGIDVDETSPPERAAAAIAALAADEAVGALIIAESCDPRHADESPTDSLARLRGYLPTSIAKPVCLVSTALDRGDELPPGDGPYVFADPVRAANTLARVAGRTFESHPDAVAMQASVFDWRAAVPDAADGLVISEHRCHALLRAAGLTVAAGRLATGVADALAAAEAFGYPLVLKAISPDVTHRAAAGLVALGIDGPEALRMAWRRLEDRARELAVSLDGIYVQRMEAGNEEIIVSALRDPVFGVVVTCGTGGVLTEAISDVVLRRAPIGIKAAEGMISRLRRVRLAPGERPPMAPLARFVSDFSRLATAVPWRRFVIEINPVKWRADSAVAVDGLILVEDCRTPP